MATTLARWDPFAEMSAMRTMMDRLFDQSLGRFPALARTGEELGSATLGLDVYENGDELVVKAAVPGVDPKDVDISVDDDILTIKGEFDQRDEVNEDGWMRRELRYGSFHRQLRLPPTVDAEKAQATFENGVMKLTLPKKPEARSRSFKITPQGVIEGEQSQPEIQQ